MPHHLLHRLQQTVGNQAVQRLLAAREASPPPRAAFLQRDFKSDFEGRTSIPAAGSTPPPDTVRVATIPGKGRQSTWVNAPYGIYSPGEIPKEHHTQIMESGKAFQWRNDGRANPAGFEAEARRLANQGELTVGDMLRLSQRGGAKMVIRIAMAKVGTEFRFVGYDMSQGGPGGGVHSGFVESEKGTTSGVGRALFADRVTRALLNQASGMHLEVYTTKRTADFHAQVFAVAGRRGAPTEGQRYELTTGEMVRLTVAWNPKLTAAQVANLNALLARGGNVSAADAEAALLRGAGPSRGPGGGGPIGGVPIAAPTSPRSQAKGKLLAWGAQALLAKQIGNVQSAEKEKAMARYNELSPVIGQLLDADFSVTVTIEFEVPKTVNFAGVITQTDPSMIVYYRNMYIDRTMKVRPKKAPGERELPGFHAVGDVDAEYANPRRWEDPHEYTLDQQIRLQMGDQDPTGADRPKRPTHVVKKSSQTFSPQGVELIESAPQVLEPPQQQKPRPELDEATAKKAADARTGVYLLSGNIVAYRKVEQVWKDLDAHPLFHVTGEAMSGGAGLAPVTRVVYWSEWDRPRAALLAEFLRGKGLPQAEAEPGGIDPARTPGRIQVNFGHDSEQAPTK